MGNGIARQKALTEDELYNAFSNAETGSFKNPWIRTTFAPKEGSTAYGPVQITKLKAVDYANRGLLSEENAKFVNEIMVPMYNKFIKYGREPQAEGYSAEYDYGGSGNFDIEEYADDYEKLAKEMLKIDYKLAKENIDNTIKLWRGKTNDLRYNAAVKKSLMGAK